MTISWQLSGGILGLLVAAALLLLLLRPASRRRRVIQGAVALALVTLAIFLLVVPGVGRTGISGTSPAPPGTRVFYLNQDAPNGTVIHDSIRALRGDTGAQVWSRAFQRANFFTTVGDVVLVATLQANQSVVYALRASDGSDIWHAAHDFFVPYVVQDGVAYLLAHDSQYATAPIMRAVRIADGTVLWTNNTRLAPQASVEIAGVDHGVVYLKTTMGKLLAFSAMTGAPLWQSDVTPQRSYFAAGYAFADADGQLVAYHGLDGVKAWTAMAGTNHIDKLFVSDNVVYTFVDNSARLLAWRLTDGHLLAQHMTTVETLNMVVQDGLVYSAATFNLPSWVQALRANDGAVVWQTTVPAGFRLLALQGGTVYGATDQAVVHSGAHTSLGAIDAATGRILWQRDAFGVDTDWLSLRAVGDVLFVGTEDAKPYCYFFCSGEGAYLNALDAHTGKLYWRVPIGSPLSIAVAPSA